MTAGIVNYGYEKEVFLLSEIEAPLTLKEGQNISLRASVNWLGCEKICVPGHADLDLKLPVKSMNPESDSRWIKTFANVRANMPKAISGWKISAFLDNEKIHLRLQKPTDFEGRLKDVYFFPQDPNVIDYAAPQRLQKEGAFLILKLNRSDSSKADPDRLLGVLTSSQSWDSNPKNKALKIDVSINKKSI